MSRPLIAKATTTAGAAERRKRKFLPSGEVPENAATWRSKKGKAKFCRDWRKAISRRFRENPRILRVAWALEWLFGKECYAFPTDSFLSKELDLPIKNVQAALKVLEDGGAVIRASVFVSGTAQRRIWASMEIVRSVFPIVGNGVIPYEEPEIIPTMGRENTGTNTGSRGYSRGLPRELEQARLSAEINERRRTRERRHD
ncbi:putative protein OS=Afipia felis OX=1035 GN=NCTC12722_02136 PE=4 SV=1 [Afipia felis]